MKWLRAVLVLLLLAAGRVGAQADLQNMHGLLERGLYNSAAYVTGPALVDSLPDNREARYLYSYALYLVGDQAAARREYDLLLDLPGGQGLPAGAAERHLGGLLAATEGDLTGAIELLDAAFRESGAYEHAMDLARIAWQGGRADLALAAYEAAADTPGGRSEAWPWLNAGRILLSQGRLDEAEAALITSIDVYEAHDPGITLPSPAYVEAFYRLGTLYERRFELTDAGEWRALALDYYRNALVGDPNYAPARDALERLGAE